MSRQDIYRVERCDDDISIGVEARHFPMIPESTPGCILRTGKDSRVPQYHHVVEANHDGYPQQRDEYGFLMLTKREFHFLSVYHICDNKCDVPDEQEQRQQAYDYP